MWNLHQLGLVVSSFLCHTFQWSSHSPRGELQASFHAQACSCLHHHHAAKACRFFSVASRFQDSRVRATSLRISSHMKTGGWTFLSAAFWAAPTVRCVPTSFVLSSFFINPLFFIDLLLIGGILSKL